MEYWRYGKITEDKRFTVQFTGETGLPFALADLLAWGVRVITRCGKILLEAGTVAGYSLTNVEQAAAEVTITLPAASHPKQDVDIYAVSVIELVKPGLPNNKQVVISERPVFLFKAIRDHV